jgi:hypothetical protein
MREVEAAGRPTRTPLIATLALKARTNFRLNFVRGLSANFRDLSAVALQLNCRKVLKYIATKSAILVPRDSMMSGKSRFRVVLTTGA